MNFIQGALRATSNLIGLILFAVVSAAALLYFLPWLFPFVAVIATVVLLNWAFTPQR